MDAEGMLQKLFDHDEPYLYMFTLPILILVCLGLRQSAVYYALGVGALLFIVPALS